MFNFEFLISYRKTKIRKHLLSPAEPYFFRKNVCIIFGHDCFSLGLHHNPQLHPLTIALKSDYAADFP